MRPLYWLSVVGQLVFFWLFLALYAVTIVPLSIILALIWGRK